MDSKSKNLRKFFAEPKNQTTRERIFFNRLSFDLKIAAARNKYHLHLYEPDVDRDGFDIVVEDGDNTLWFQTKAVLSSAGTSTWEASTGLLRPNLMAAESYGFDPVEAGRGGGIILIEIDDSNTGGQVTYSYTDFDIIVAISEGFLIERPRRIQTGRPPAAARQVANEAIQALRVAKRDEKVSIPEKLFVRLKSPDDLLGVMGLHTQTGYGSFALRKAYRRVIVEDGGNCFADTPVDETSLLHYHIGLLLAAQADSLPANINGFDCFNWTRPTSHGNIPPANGP
ncbi:MULTISPECIES: hypothetical protein [unclassified Rhizobium]|uniref:hypothetical protein n=1 Tax=unclassified Rhizobium TaxID=2613769 RepID=UPI0014488AE7|nr:MULTISPECIES: hypothetical protein [unclassified Rhizobium]NKJ07903.1 hypothetical protein [Rhizobium sp. SG741]NKJ36855.1 hypothetical protein [Rhizobium sp. SG570]